MFALFLYNNSKRRMFRYLTEPRNILTETLGSAEPRLKNNDIRINPYYQPTIVKISRGLDFKEKNLLVTDMTES